MKKLLITLCLIFIPAIAWATTAFNSAQVGSSASNGYVLQTNGSISTWVATSSLGISGGGGVLNTNPFSATYFTATSTTATSTFPIASSTTFCLGSTCKTSWPSGTVTSVGLSSTNSTLTIGSTPVTTSGTITADLNLTHANTWTGGQTFGAATTTSFAITGLTNTVLAVNGNGSVIATTTSGGGGTPAGASSTVQFNANGAFGGDNGFVYTGGNVGIGTTNPSNLLSIYSSTTNSTIGILNIYRSSSWVCGDSVTGQDGLTYGTVVGADGNCWLDRNLGATEVATGQTDSAAYGALYQWGRGVDGHQIVTSGTTGTQSTTDSPGNGNFIIGYSDWRNPGNDSLWQGVSGTNNPCPTGFRVPTQPEIATEWTDEGITNSATAYASNLKLTLAGYRDYGSGGLYDQGNVGYYWSSSVNGTYAYYPFFSSGGVLLSYLNNRADGFSVRCLKDSGSVISPTGSLVNWNIGIKNNDQSFRISNSTTFGTNDDFVINNSGNVGIGTVSPATTLDVNGLGRMTEAASTTVSCTSTYYGAQEYSIADDKFYGCSNSGGWTQLGGATAGVSSVSGTYPVQVTAGATPVVSLAFGTTTSNTWANTQSFGSTTFRGLASTFLAVDGSGNLIATTTPTGGTGTPSGASSTIQFNANGVFGGDSNLTWNGSVLSITGTIANKEYTPATTTSITINWNNGTQQNVKLGTSATTIGFSNDTAGQIERLVVCQSPNGTTTVTWTGVDWGSTGVPTLSATAGKCDLMTFMATNASTTATTAIFGGYNLGF